MGWLHREARGSIITPVSLANPGDGWVTQSISGSATSSAGIDVSETTARKLSAVYACRQILAETMATTSLHLKQRKPGGDVRMATEHPLYDVLSTVACPDLEGRPAVTAFAFREFMQAAVCMRGKAYAQKVLDGRGRIVGLNPLRPDRMMISVINGKTNYRYTPDDSGTREFRPDELLRIHYCLDDDSVTPISPIRANAEALGIAVAVNRYSGQFFANGAAISGVFEHPGTLKEDGFKRLDQQLRDRTASGGKGHSGLILEGGMTWKAVQVNPDDAQALQSRTFSIREICRIFRIPPHMVADLEQATFSNIEFQSIGFAQYTMMPWFERWEQAIQMDLLSPAERAAGYFVDFDVRELTRGDTAAQNAYYSAGRQWGYLSANDVRRDLQMPILGADGDVYLTPVNMIPADQVAALTGSPPPSAIADPNAIAARDMLAAQERRHAAASSQALADRSAVLHSRVSRQFRGMFEDAFARIAARGSKDLRRIVKRNVDARGGTDFESDLDAVRIDCQTFAEKALRAVVAGAFEAHIVAQSDIMGAPASEPDAQSHAAAADIAKNLAKTHAEALRTAVREAVFGSPVEVVAEKIEAILAENERRGPSQEAERALETITNAAKIAAKRAFEAPAA